MHRNGFISQNNNNTIRIILTSYRLPHNLKRLMVIWAVVVEVTFTSDHWLKISTGTN